MKTDFVGEKPPPITFYHKIPLGNSYSIKEPTLDIQNYIITQVKDIQQLTNLMHSTFSLIHNFFLKNSPD